MAQLKTNFSEKMGELVKKLEKAIDDMELYDEAYKAGFDNVQGLINGAGVQKAALVAKYTELANAALEAYKKVMQQMSPSKTMKQVGA